jgi:hypothetical protein
MKRDRDNIETLSEHVKFFLRHFRPKDEEFFVTIFFFARFFRYCFSAGDRIEKKGKVQFCYCGINFCPWSAFFLPAGKAPQDSVF